MSTLTLSKPVAATLATVSGAQSTLQVCEKDSFELDVRITVPHALRPLLGLNVTYSSACVDGGPPSGGGGTTTYPYHP